MDPQATPITPAEARLVQIEGRLRRMTGLVSLLIVMALVQTAWHLMPGPPSVSAERFVVKRRGGTPVAEFSIWPDGTPAFRINNDAGEARSLWSLRRDGTLSLRMSDASHRTRLELWVDPEGLPHVSLHGSDARSRVHLWVDGEDRAALDYPRR